jgi:hypothetical protein
MAAHSPNYSIPPPLKKIKKSEAKRDNCFKIIDDLLKSKFTGKIELNTTQGAVVALKKEEIIKL